MNRHRLDRLERAFTGATPPAACPECGGPLGAHDPVVLVDEEMKPLDPACPACGLLVDADGRARLKSTRWSGPHQKRIVLGGGED
ncbi:MAG TPA: hypothetical protein PLU35_14750 [Phycisphaerales bacterium]|nr:hypothetical protein [Phycisphaerales bacterium]